MDLSWIVTHCMKGEWKQHVKTGHPKLPDLREGRFPKPEMNNDNVFLWEGSVGLSRNQGITNRLLRKSQLDKYKKRRETCDCGVRCGSGRHSAQQFDPCLRCCQASPHCHHILYPPRMGCTSRRTHSSEPMECLPTSTWTSRQQGAALVHIKTQQAPLQQENMHGHKREVHLSPPVL